LGAGCFRQGAKKCFYRRGRRGGGHGGAGPYRELRLGRPLLTEVAPLLSKVAYLV
jgi:hypothetical protein